MNVTETTALSLLLGLGLGTAFIVYNVKVWTHCPLSVWSKPQLTRKRIFIGIVNVALLVASLAILLMCRGNLELFYSALATFPVFGLGILEIRRVSEILRTEESVLNNMDLPDFTAPYVASKSDKWIAGIVIAAIVVLTILAWMKM